MKPNKNTVLNMVIGNPLDHTKSPFLHNTIYRKLKLNALLLAFPHKNVAALIHAIKTLSIELTAVTMPHKESIVKHLDYCSSEVRVLKAANTVIQIHQKLYGYNTDVYGIEYALRKISLKNKNVLIIGAGGAARAASYVINKHKGNLYLFNRTPRKAMSLAKLFKGTVVKNITDVVIDIIINTTPIGMKSSKPNPQKQQSPLPHYSFNKNQVVFDMIYNPTHTPLLKRAKKMGARTISGIEMFNAQGRRQIELWLEKKGRAHEN